MNSLPDYGIPHDIVSVERENEGSECFEPDFNPQNEDDIVYNEETDLEMNSFLPIPQYQQQEIQAVHQQLFSSHHNQAISWPTIQQ